VEEEPLLRESWKEAADGRTPFADKVCRMLVLSAAPVPE
jgi:hypothetical protein